MCEKCFNTEIQYFETPADFEEFDLLLTKKIGNEKSIQMGEFVNTAWKDIGYQIFKCVACGQLWKLLKPGYSERGYFLWVR